MKIDRLVPEVYYKESRDFSYIGRLFEIVCNYMKTQADLVGVPLQSEYINADLIELAAKTVGFETKHTYINKDLLALVNNFADIIKEKGSIASVEKAVRLLSRCHNLKISSLGAVTINKEDPYKLNILLPYGTSDVVLLEDLLNYILPTGWLYEIEYGDAAAENPETTMPSNTDSVTIVSYAEDEAADLSSLATETADVSDEGSTDKKRRTWPTGVLYDNSKGESEEAQQYLVIEVNKGETIQYEKVKMGNAEDNSAGEFDRLKVDDLTT